MRSFAGVNLNEMYVLFLCSYPNQWANLMTRAREGNVQTLNFLGDYKFFNSTCTSW